MFRQSLSAFVMLLAGYAMEGAEPRNDPMVLLRGGLPRRVHVFEDYETDIEKRWWLRGVPETNNVAPSLSASVPNRRSCRATLSKDFDDKMGDPTKTYKAVVFNPVPGPPMGPQTRLRFRYFLKGTDKLRVQIYSLSFGFHRSLWLTNLSQGSWRLAAVEMTQARRPDGSGGPLAEDERIDDIQFYAAPEAELLIDDIVLYDAGPGTEGTSPFLYPLFTGWFDTGGQGAGKEWPGDFEIVKHEAPLTWKAAKAVLDPKSGQPWIRIDLRGERPMSELARLRFRYRLVGGDNLNITLANQRTGKQWSVTMRDLFADRWSEATTGFYIGDKGMSADELRFVAPKSAALRVDDVMLFDLAERESFVRMVTPSILVAIANNEAYLPAHRAGYNGMAEFSFLPAGGRNFFVPAYAGLNLEHIFSGDSDSFGWNIFEPRRSPMELVHTSAKTIELHQKRTEHWPLRSRLVYDANGDGVDFTYCGTPLADAWKKHGYIGVFFASYINQPPDMSVQFIGRSREGRGDTRPRWIKHLPPKHGVAASHRPAGSNWDPPLDEGFNIDLVKGLSDLEYDYPFYFGTSGDDVFLMMFERARDGSELRFAQSPSGGGAGNPAWDFAWCQRGYALNREFCFRARAVLRKGLTAEEAVQLYEQWSGEKVARLQEAAAATATQIQSRPARQAMDWIEPMKRVHSRFRGTNGTFAQFGDSITVTMAFWAPLAGEPKGLNAEATRAQALVKRYMKPDCWAKWKGAEFGNEGSMTIRWARQNLDRWLGKLNPEAAVIMFGSNDVDQMDASEYERTTREVVRRCQENGTVVLLTTAPPRSSRFEKSMQFAEVIRKIAREEQVPLIDYFDEILKRRPQDWDGSLPQFKSAPGDEYQVPTLIARDGVHPSNPKAYSSSFSDDALNHNGYALRNYLTLLVYADVIQSVLGSKQEPQRSK